MPNLTQYLSKGPRSGERGCRRQTVDYSPAEYGDKIVNIPEWEVLFFKEH